MPPTAEHARLPQATTSRRPWKKWGPYLSERQWGTVREDYSPDGAAWEYFPHITHAPAPTGGEKMGIAGSPTKNSACGFALALWEREGPILKERLFWPDEP